jgi:hypothetical protein
MPWLMNAPGTVGLRKVAGTTPEKTIPTTAEISPKKIPGGKAARQWSPLA